MGKTFNLSVVIGAALSGTFKSTIGGALGQVKGLGTAIQRLESGRADIDRFRELKTGLVATKSALAAAQTEAGRLAREFKAADLESARLGKDLAAAKERLAAVAAEMKGAKRPGEELKQAYAAAKAEVKSLGEAQRQAARQASALGESFSAARAKVGSLKAQVESQGVSLQRLRQQMQQAGISTRSLAADQAKLGAALERARSAQAKLGAALAAQKSNLEKRAQYRGQLFDAVAMGASIAAPMKAAIDFESAMADVGKAVNFEQPDGLVQMGRTIKEMARDIPVSQSGLAKITEAGGKLGIDSNMLEQYTKLVAIQSVAFDMSAEEAGTSMAKIRNIYDLSLKGVTLLGDAINYLGDKSASNERDIVNVMTRIGGTARMIGMAAEKAAAWGSTMVSLGRAPEVAATGLNALMIKLYNADKGNKKFQNGLIKAGISAKKLKQAMLKDANGALLAFLETLAKVPKDKQSGILVDLFGMEYADDIAILIGGIKELRKELGYVAEESNYAGSTQKVFEARKKTTANYLQLLKNRVVEAGINFGTVFLSGTIAVASGIGKCTTLLAILAERFPLLTKVIGGTIVGFIGLRVATIGFGYASTFVMGGINTLKVAFASLTARIAQARIGMTAFNATAGGTALGGVAARALTPVRAIGNAVLHPITALRSLGSTLAGLGRGAARGAGAGLRSIGSAALGMGRFLLNPVGALRSLGGAMLGFARLAVPAVVGGIRAIGLAIVSNPVGVGLAVITGAALLIYKYWEPVKSFFGGFWQGFKGGFSSVFGGIGAALAPLQPVFNAVGTAVNWVWNGIKSLVAWFGNLLGPANTSSETLKQCASAGQVVGQVLGVVVGGAVKLLIAPFQLLGSAVQFVWNLFKDGPYQAVVNGFNQVKAWLENFSLADVGRKIIGTLVDGIKSVGSAVKNAVKSAFTHADPMFPHSDAAEGPFSRLTASGRALMETFGAGIEAAGSRALVNPLGRIFGAARQLLSRPLGAAANLMPNLRLSEVFAPAKRLLGATALALPLVLQPNLALPDLQARASWNITRPAIPGLPNLGAALNWRSIPPAAPAMPEIGAAIRAERPKPEISALSDRSGVRSGMESPSRPAPITINMTGDIVVHAAPGADGADIAAQVREQVRLALEEARRSLEAEQRGALHD